LAQERNIIITGSLPNILRQSSERNHANHKQQIQEEDDEEVIDTRMQVSSTYFLQCIWKNIGSIVVVGDSVPSTLISTFKKLVWKP
jgi:hypothetical protein